MRTSRELVLRVLDRRSPRGLTLIELMLAMAMTTILLAAASALVLSIMQGRKLNTARLEVKTTSTVAAGQIQYDAANAGFRFASPAFAVRVLQNIAGTEAEIGSLATNCGGMTGWTLQPGTDVLELRRGLDVLPDGGVAVVPGVLTGVSCTSAGVCDLTVGNGAFPNPFVTTAGPDGASNIILFVNSMDSCAAVVSGAGVSSPQFQVQLVKQDLVTNAGNTEYPHCPIAGMSVMRLGLRQRYLVCAPPVGDATERPRLYRQTLNGANAAVSMDRVQDGVEDLQVSVRLDNTDGVVSGTGCVGAGPGAFCWCNTGSGTCTGYEPDPTASGTLDWATGSAATKSAYLLRGLRVAITGISTRAAVDSPAFADLTAPTLYDHDAGTTQSANLRNSTQVAMALQNLVMVSP